MNFLLRVLGGLATVGLLVVALYLIVLAGLYIWKSAIALLMVVWTQVEETNAEFRSFLRERFKKEDKK
jgi:type IV secretory pathway TrbD component